MKETAPNISEEEIEEPIIEGVPVNDWLDAAVVRKGGCDDSGAPANGVLRLIDRQTSTVFDEVQIKLSEESFLGNGPTDSEVEGWSEVIAHMLHRDEGEEAA